jgi:hypothetical protein
LAGAARARIGLAHVDNAVAGGARIALVAGARVGSASLGGEEVFVYFVFGLITNKKFLHYMINLLINFTNKRDFYFFLPHFDLIKERNFFVFS